MSDHKTEVNLELIHEISTPFYTAKLLEIPTRRLTYYDEKDLLFQNEHSSKNKRRFTLVQAVWLQIISDLFQFGFSSDTIGGCRNLFEKIRLENSLLSKRDLLTAITYEVIERKYDNRIIFTADGSFVLLNFSLYSIHDLAAYYSDSAHINIPLIPKIAPLWKIYKNEEAKVHRNKNLRLDTREHAIISEMRNRDLISVHYKGAKNEKPTGLLTTMERIDPSTLQPYSHFFRNLKHCVINISFRDQAGKPVSVTKEQRKIIKT